MTRKEKSNPSFFKILSVVDFTQKLQLPPYFVRILGDTLPKNATLRNTFSGRTWDVKIERNGKCCCFTKEWSKFVQDFKLERGELVVFWYDKDDSSFDVAAYGIHGSEKKIMGCDFRVKSEPCELDDVNEESDYGSDEDLVVVEDLESESEAEFQNPTCPKFEMVFKGYHHSRLALPSDFVRKAGLAGKQSVVLEYAPEQRFATVNLDQRANRLDIAFGWNEFHRQNSLACGKTYSFVFNEARNVIQVQPVGKNLQNESQRGRKRKSPDVQNEKRKGKKRTSLVVKKPNQGMKNEGSRPDLDRSGSSSKIRTIVNKECSKTYQRAKAFREIHMLQRSSFVSFMQPSYLSKCILTIPMSIVRDKFHGKISEIKLRVSNRKPWPVMCKCSGNNGYLCGGWKGFTMENKLKVGDACAFEVNKNNKFIWDVTIFRC